MSVARKLTTFGRLPVLQKLAFFEAMLLLTVAHMLVNLVPLGCWRKQIVVTPRQDSPAEQLTRNQRRKSRMVMHTIARVNRNLPVNFVCLPQALAARWMLSRRDVPTELFLGTPIAAGEDREFHAWLKAGDTIITGHCDETAFAVFGSQRSI